MVFFYDLWRNGEFEQIEDVNEAPPVPPRLGKACLKPRRRRRITSLSSCRECVHLARMGIRQDQGFGLAMSLSHKMACGWMERALPRRHGPDFLDKLLGGSKSCPFLRAP